MGHFPDYSFAQYRYKPCWRAQSDPPFVRDNPREYAFAFLELCSLFARARGYEFEPDTASRELAAAKAAISAPCELADESECPRVHSSERWLEQMNGLGIEAPLDIIDARNEDPDRLAVLGGQLDYRDALGTRYGTYYVSLASDLYLFEIAVDYHFQFVRHWLRQRGIFEFRGSWSQQRGPVSERIEELF